MVGKIIKGSSSGQCAGYCLNHDNAEILCWQGLDIDNIRLDIMPAAIFTNPEAACVGKTEDQLKAEGVEIEVRPCTP